MENTYYDDKSNDDIFEIVCKDLKTDEVPFELRDVAKDIIAVKFVSRDIMIGFLDFCDDYENWIDDTGGELVANYIRATYDMNEIGIID